MCEAVVFLKTFEKNLDVVLELNIHYYRYVHRRLEFSLRVDYNECFNFVYSFCLQSFTCVLR